MQLWNLNFEIIAKYFAVLVCFKYSYKHYTFILHCNPVTCTITLYIYMYYTYIYMCVYYTYTRI